MSSPMPDVTIVGGGIIGCALAWELTTRGVTCEILERRELAHEASWASAGIISPPSPALRVRADLAVPSFKRYPALVDEIERATGVSVGYVAGGEIELGTDDTAGELRSTLDWRVEHGIDAEWLDNRGLHDREPAIAGPFTCGVLTPGGGSVRLGELSRALARGARARGARIVEHTEVLELVVRDGRVAAALTFDGERPVGTVVLAAGAWSGRFGASLDYPLPTRPVKGQVIAIADPPIPIRSVIAGGGGYLVPRADGTVLVGATHEPDAGFDVRVTPRGVAQLTDVARAVAPSLVEARLADAWAGLRPAVDGAELLIGRIPTVDNAWVATGHFRLGGLLAPATASALADSIASNRVAHLLAPFNPAARP